LVGLSVSGAFGFTAFAGVLGLGTLLALLIALHEAGSKLFNLLHLTPPTVKLDYDWTKKGQPPGHSAWLYTLTVKMANITSSTLAKCWMEVDVPKAFLNRHTHLWGFKEHRSSAEIASYDGSECELRPNTVQTFTIDFEFKNDITENSPELQSRITVRAFADGTRQMTTTSKLKKVVAAARKAQAAVRKAREAARNAQAQT